MSKIIERFVRVELKSGQRHDFPSITEEERNTDNFHHNGGQVAYSFVSLEIKSMLPPTDVLLVFDFLPNGKTFEVELMKYRENFRFENGFYILPNLESFFPKVMKKPISIQIDNRRDKTCVINLFYRLNITQP